MMNVATQNYDGGNRNFNIEAYPNECPYCHMTVHPRFDKGTYNDQNGILELIFYCTNYKCNRLFIVFYKTSPGGAYKIDSMIFGNPKSKVFSENIKAISPMFVKIYDESYLSEQLGLSDICGAGYRKSLEFLIKDYLISKNDEKALKIKKKFLANCINEDIDNANIKKVAARAAWLGNDEIHYERKWDDKDLTNLKDLIQLTINWIENEILTQKYEQDMPDKNKSEVIKSPDL